MLSIFEIKVTKRLSDIQFYVIKKLNDYFSEGCTIEQEVTNVCIHCRPTTDEETLELSRMLLSTPDSYRQLVDFDNHFDDLSKDWRNLQIAEYIDRST